MLQTRWFANAALLGVAFVWGATFVVVQDAVAILPPFTFNFVRFALAALMLLLFLACTGKNNLRLPAGSRRRHLAGGMVLGFWLFVGYAFQTFSLLYTTSAKSGFLTGLSVALVPVLAYFILRQKPSRQAIIGVLLAVCGLYLLAFRDLSAVNIGDLMAFICAFGFGLQIVYTGKYSPRSSVFHLVLIQFAAVSALSGISAAIWERDVRPELLAEPKVLWALLITSLFATTLAFLAQTYFQKTTDPAQVALIFATEPIFAALTDYVWNGTAMGTVTVIGFAFIFAGMVMAEVPLGKLREMLRPKVQAK